MYHCKHPGGPELSSCPHSYCVTRMVHDLVVVVDGLIANNAFWQLYPFESTITTIRKDTNIDSDQTINLCINESWLNLL